MFSVRSSFKAASSARGSADIHPERFLRPWIRLWWPMPPSCWVPPAAVTGWCMHFPWSSSNSIRIIAHRAANFEAAEQWDLDFWQKQTPQQRLSALVSIRKDILKVKSKIDHLRHRKDARVLREVRKRNLGISKTRKKNWRISRFH